MTAFVADDIDFFQPPPHGKARSAEMDRPRGYAAVGIVSPKHDVNVGGVMRAASAFGAALVVTTGRRYRAEPSDTSKAYRQMPVLNVDDLRSVIPYDCVPVAVEITDNACSLPQYTHPERAFYVFGPEDGSLGVKVTSWCRDVIQIPTAHCLNLAATVNVVLYDRMAKSSVSEGRKPVDVDHGIAGGRERFREVVGGLWDGSDFRPGGLLLGDAIAGLLWADREIKMLRGEKK